jgi:6-phosphogluconolactonase (cycloisomerase 2 family)
MPRKARLLPIGTFALMLLLALSVYSAAQSDFVYVESNKAENNSILIFKNSGGSLKFVEEQPTHGKGIFDLSLNLGPFDSDQAVITNAEGTLLYAVNSGSNSIAAFHVAKDGRLSALDGSPFSSGGTNPVSVGIARDTLVVVNKAMDPAQPQSDQPSYASFYLNPDGTFVSGPISRVAAPAGSSPSQANISSGKRLVFDAQFLGGHLQSFLLGQDGTLMSEDFQAPPGTALPLGLWAHPNKPILYVGFVNESRLGVYTFDSAGNLTFVRSVADSGQAICWVRANTAGTRLYTSNTVDNSISVYDSSNPLRPLEIQHLVLSGQGNSFQITLAPQEDYLYVITQRGSSSIPLGEGNTLHVLRVDPVTGKLSGDKFVSLQVPSGTRPQGVAAVHVF